MLAKLMQMRCRASAWTVCHAFVFDHLLASTTWTQMLSITMENL